MAMNYGKDDTGKEKPRKQGTPMLTYVAIILALTASGGTAAYTTEAINSIETIREIPVSQNTEEITILQQTNDAQQEQIAHLAEQLEEMQEKLQEEQLIEETLASADEQALEEMQERLQQIQSDVAVIMPPVLQHTHEGIASELQGTNEGLGQISNNFKEFRNEIRETTNIFNNRINNIENIATQQTDLTQIRNDIQIINDRLDMINPDLAGIEQRLTEVEFKVGVLLADFSDLRTAFVNHLEDYAEHLIEFEIARGN
jgi:DNA repair exonuclease SbcCD ATPase subunit